LQGAMACSPDHRADYGRNCQRVAGTGEAFALFFVEFHRLILRPYAGLGQVLELGRAWDIHNVD
jgi:hypothetical protein